jgi:hypothetical protein
MTAMSNLPAARCAASADAEVALIASDAHWSSGLWQNVLVFVWRGVPDREHILRSIDAVRTVTRRFSRMGLIVVIEPDSPPPSAELRPIVARGMQECGEQVAGAAYVVVTAGFQGALIRSAVTAISLFAREPYPTKTFRAVPDAVAWTTTRLPIVGDRDALLRAIEAVRVAVHEPPPG